MCVGKIDAERKIIAELGKCSSRDKLSSEGSENDVPLPAGPQLIRLIRAF